MRVTVTDDSPASDGKFLCDSVEGRGAPSAEMLTIGGVMGETTDPGDCHYTGLGLAPGEVGRQPCAPTLRGDQIRYISTV